MPYMEMPQFKSVPDKMLDISSPAIGGLNLKDLEFEQETNQTPYMLNLMYRNGALGKRYGQEVYKDYAFEHNIVTSYFYNKTIIVHAGTKIYKSSGQGFTQIGTVSSEEKGIFIVHMQLLYYLHDGKLYKYNGKTFGQASMYVPIVRYQCEPDGTYEKEKEQYNILSDRFSHQYIGRSGQATYHIYDSIIIDKTMSPTITVNGASRTAFTVDWTQGTINFSSAPAEQSTVIVTWSYDKENSTIKDFLKERDDIFACKYWQTYGGANNSRLFLAGCGKSKYYYSSGYDLTYFPYANWAIIGNTEDDITGFGRQYNTLFVFKPREIYSVSAYIIDSSNSLEQERYGTEDYKSQLVNASVGCDCPNTIQLINNYLTWFNTNEGICTLVSTSIADERNVRVISRNIERTNSFGVKGILDFDEANDTIQSADFENKYFLVFPKSGMCFMWDYEISPYVVTTRGSTDPRALDWYLFDNFYVKEFLRVGKELLYVGREKGNSSDSLKIDISKQFIKLNNSFIDLDFDNSGSANAIKSYYMTPFIQFGAVEYLKNVKNIYVQCRGDVSSVIDMYYYTEENGSQREGETIRIGGRLWNKFRWNNFEWFMANWANVFRRKCNLKKIQMASFYFENNEFNRDMSITHIGLQYQLVKYVR